MGNFAGHINPIRIEGLSDLANEFVNKIGNDWNRYLWKVSLARKQYPDPICQVTLNEAIDILRPHLDKYNTPERMVGQELWDEIATYTCVKIK